MKRFEALTEPTGETSPLHSPIFSSQIGTQTVKMQFGTPAQKMQKEVRADEGRTSFFTDNLKLR